MLETATQFVVLGSGVVCSWKVSQGMVQEITVPSGELVMFKADDAVAYQLSYDPDQLRGKLSQKPVQASANQTNLWEARSATH